MFYRRRHLFLCRRCTFGRRRCSSAQQQQRARAPPQRARRGLQRGGGVQPAFSNDCWFRCTIMLPHSLRCYAVGDGGSGHF